jgi:DNA-binding MarR family transcriptional regulator
MSGFQSTGGSVLADQDFRVIIARLNRRFRQRYRQGRSTDELSPLELTLLHRVRHIGPCSATAVAVREGVTSPSASKALGSLRRRGLVCVTADPRDRRRWRIELSPEGYRQLERREGQLSEDLAELPLTAFTAEEIECLCAAVPLLGRLADLL